MYGKLVNNRFQTAPKVLKLTISNPTNEQYEDFGYKELFVDDEPEYNPETQYLTEYYEEQTDKIIKHWQINDIPQEGGEVE